MLSPAKFGRLLNYFLFATIATSRAELTLPMVLSDHMVLQRERRVPIWGQANPNETITVRFADQEKRTQADSSGHWRLFLDPLLASAHPRDLTITGTRTIQLHDILVGEVWLCGGQSNMEYAVGRTTAGAQPATASDPALAEEIKTARYPELRFFRVEKKLQPPDVVSAGWTEASGESLAMFSAIGFFFGREIHRELGVPVGMIQAAWGGSRIEPWTPPGAYADLPSFKSEWAHSPLMIDGVAPGKNYDGMVRPLAPYALRGVLWYQGETQIIACNDGLRYADKFLALVRGWREAWGSTNAPLPFYSVQLAPFIYSARKDKLPHGEDELPKLWEAQAQSLAIPQTGLVPIADTVDNVKNIHPGNKATVAHRLAALALARTYNRSETVCAGPIFSKIEIKDSKAIIHFAQIDAGLKTRGGDSLTDFEIAGSDGKFFPGTAVIANAVVEVRSDDVPSPIAVRFGWHETARPNLENAQGWPAYPFRTDGPTWTPPALEQNPRPAKN